LPSIARSLLLGLLGVLAYTGARVGAVAKLRMADYRDLGGQRALRFREKGGREREIPVRHDLEGWLNEYIAAAGIEGDAKTSPLFRATAGTTKLLILNGLEAHGIRRMLKRRLNDADLPHLYSRTVSASRSSRIFSIRTFRLKMYNIWPATRVRQPRASMTADACA
jgi:integrase